MTKLKLSVLSLLLYGGFLFAQKSGGMWIPTELNEVEMKQMGMKISAADIFNPNAPSIKDAVAHFGGGCTSEVISPEGLLLTNHHCGFGQIQKHSSLENDYIKDGFWAKNHSEELPNPGLTATFIVDIRDVTDGILQGTDDDMDEQKRQDIVKDNIDIISANTVKESYQDVFIRPFYKGNKYYLFITETYRDVRLVGAPPSAIGNFGMDTDNWSWPRHVGDFSLFRIYADKDNKPAEYSADNVPYTPKHYLPVNSKGIKEGDFTFVFGFPGTTNEYLPSSAIEQILEVTNPTKIGIRDVALKILMSKMKVDDATRIKYASKYARISNYHKKWTGESLGLVKSNAVQKKKDYEAEFTQRISQNPELESKYGSLLSEFDELYKESGKYEKAENYFNEAIYGNSETFRVALLMNNLLKSYGSTNFNSLKERYQNYLSGLYKDYDPDLDQEVSLALIDLYKKEMPKEFQPADGINITGDTFKNSFVTGKANINGVSIIGNTAKAFENEIELLNALQSDPLVQQISKIEEVYGEKVSPIYTGIQSRLSNLQRKYMKAQMEVFPDKLFFPDANSTLRVTYGKVDGYQPSDKPTRYEPITYLDEAMKKYIPGDYEFDLPQKLMDLEAKKDFGPYGVGKGKKARMPIDFIATNHTTGGNSGSPVLDKDGNLIGLNFDRVWEGTMSDLNYDPEICRNIMVDARYILFIIDKFADAGYLLNEMTIIR
ncbi:MAG: S46 family peptidase [Flavobacteriia bacterium]|nr:S46 family peptidase [Flavobacteriia bacterium]